MQPARMRKEAHVARERLLRIDAGVQRIIVAADLIQQVQLNVVREEQRIIPSVSRDQADRHEERARNFFDRDTLPLHLGWEARQRDVDPVLRLHGGDVGVRAQLERHLDVQ